MARSPRLYAQLVRDLDVIDYLQFTRTPWGAWAFFCVAKKSTMSRLILDARSPNMQFGLLPGTSLLTAEGLTMTDTSDRPGEPLSMAMCGVKDCYLRLRLPAWYARWFCLPAVRR